jgi:hypothetical protein
VIALKPGTFSPEVSDLFFRADWMTEGSVHLETAELEIIGVNNFVSEYDINQDGSITASDALLVINELNDASQRRGENEAFGQLSTVTINRIDVNRDGNLTATDALRIINWLNGMSNGIALEAEGEAAADIDQIFDNPQFMHDLDEIVRAKRRFST